MHSNISFFFDKFYFNNHCLAQIFRRVEEKLRCKGQENCRVCVDEEDGLKILSEI